MTTNPQPIVITPDSHEHWLQLRSEDITSTEVSALFSASPYSTLFELYHTKHDHLPGNFTDNDRMMWGRELEAVIARRTAEKLGLTIQPMKEYIRHATVERMGSSFDFGIKGVAQTDVYNTGTVEAVKAMCGGGWPVDGPGILECKNVDGLIYRDQWLDDEAPEHIEFQIQHQMEVANLDWGIIAALVGGNDLKLLYRERNRAMGEGLCKAITKFWADVDADAEPDFTDADAGFIISMYQNAGTETIDLSGDEEAKALAISYDFHAAQAKLFTTGKQAAHAGILMKMGEAGKAVLDGFKVSATMTKGCHVEYDRGPYRGFKLTKSKE